MLTATIFQKKANEHELYLIKPEFLSLLNELENKLNDFDSESFQILNTLAVDYKSLIVSDLEILTKFIKLIANLLKSKHKSLPEPGRKWAFRVLRWILVVDPDVGDLEELKKCYLMAVTSRQFYLTQLEIGLERLIEKISVYISVKDEKIISLLLDGYAEYFKLYPKLMNQKILNSLNAILDKLLELNLFHCLPDNFVSNLVLECDSYYYLSLDLRFRKGLCRAFEDIFVFEVLRIESKVDWFCFWLAEDLEQFKKFCEFVNRGNGGRIFLEQTRRDIIEIGRREGYHSLYSYENILKNI